MKLIFFSFFYVCLGTIGITIPWFISGTVSLSEIAIGLVTIAISSVGYNASEKFLQFYDERPSKKAVLLFYLLSLLVTLILSILVCITVSKGDSDGKNYEVLYYSIPAYLISCIFWWVQNWNNRNFENTSASTLGGKAEQFNRE